MTRALFRTLSTALAVLVFSVSCAIEKGFKAPNPSLVTGVTAGSRSIYEPLKVEFARDMGDFQSSISIELEPKVDGKVTWQDASTLVFTPKNWFERAKKYRVIVSGTKEGKALFDSFGFSFYGKEQHLNVTANQVKLENDNTASLLLKIDSSDRLDEKSVLGLLSLSKLGDIKTKLTHDPVNDTFEILVSRIQRGDKNRDLEIGYDGSTIGSKDRGVIGFKVPGTSEFSFVGSKVYAESEDYVELSFSDQLDPVQDFKGVITTKEGEDLSVVVKGNLLRLYKSTGWSKHESLVVRNTLRSKSQKRLAANSNIDVTFPSKLPEVQFATKGVIIPTTQGLTLPIETTNLSYVMVEATQVFQNNVTQFLQVNSLDGKNELYRVGNVVWRQIVKLDWKPEYVDKKRRIGLDLSPLIKKFPGGMFNITLTFRKPHVVWNSVKAVDDQPEDSVLWGPVKTNYDAQESSWDYAEDYYYEEDSEDGNGYDDRKNPESSAFYRKYYDHDITISKNLIVSDIGLLARRGSDGALEVTATDLRTAGPLSNVKIEVQSYQKQKLATFETDQNGQGKVIQLKEQPYFVVANKDGQYSYLKITDGEALAISQFDISGDKIENGVAGMIYGERGVWRPGDEMHLVFLLWDANGVIPKDHPILFSLLNPEGKTRDTKTLTKGVNGFYYFKTKTDPEALTGNWLAKVVVGNKTFTKTLKVETVMPNRLKIEVEAEGVPSNKTANLHAEWLTGLPAPNLKANVKAFLTAMPTLFDGPYSDFSFDDGTKTFKFDPYEVFDGSLDSKGNAKLSYSNLYSSDAAPGRLSLSLATRVFESSGAFSVDTYSTNFDPYKEYVGLALPKGDAARNMLLTDTDHQVRIVLLKPDGSKVTTGRVKLEVFKANWRWWWETGSNGSDYREQENYQLMQSSNVDIKAGQGTGTFKIKYPEWGRFLIKVTNLNGGHSATKFTYVDWPGWAGRPAKDGPGGASMLLATSNKTKYNVGDDIVIAIPGNEKAKALVSIEARGRIIKNEWIDLKGKSTDYVLKASPEMAPNIYAHIHLFQPHAQTENDLPIRMYGVIPISIENEDTRLSPVIETVDSVKPESSFKISVSETKGRPMTYTLAIVDEGLLGLTRYKAPNPWDSFYRRQASLVRTWDLFSYVAGAYSGKLESLLAVGGSDDLLNQRAEKPNRFPPVVIFKDPVTLEAGQTNVHEIKLPPYLGAVRVMVVAADTKGGFGASEKSLKVVQELMARMTLPRVIGPGEQSIAPVTMTYMGPVPQTVKVTLNVTGAANLVGSSTQEIKFTKTGEQTLRFNVQAKNQIGSTKIVASAVDEKGNSSVDTVNLEVRSQNLSSTKVLQKLIEANGTWTQDLGKLAGLPGTNTAVVELSTIPPFDLSRRLDYLIHYPYGCIEQTTSSVFPQLYLADVVDLSDAQKSAIGTNIDAGIKRLESFTTSNGGFSYWPGESDANPWGSVYAAHFLVEAKRGGFSVPDEMYQGVLGFLRSNANSYKNTSDDYQQKLQTYTLYVMALAGQPMLGPMNVLSSTTLSPQATYRLASTYKLAGIESTAKKLVANLTTTVKPYRELDGSFGSELRDTAIILESLLLMNMTTESVPLAKLLSERLSKDYWLSTQETAFALIALSKFSKNGWGMGNTVSASLSYEGKDLGPVETKKRIVQIALPLDNVGKTLVVNNKGSAVLYARVLLSGVPPVGSEEALGGFLNIEASLKTADGNVIWAQNAMKPTKPSASGTELAIGQGRDLKFTIKVSNLSVIDLNQLALSALVPSGFEILNENIQGQKDAENSAYDYRDIRDDRVNFFYSLKKGESKTFVVSVNASYIGRYYLPMIRTEAMYNVVFQAQVPGQWIQIKP